MARTKAELNSYDAGYKAGQASVGVDTQTFTYDELRITLAVYASGVKPHLTIQECVQHVDHFLKSQAAMR